MAIGIIENESTKNGISSIDMKTYKFTTEMQPLYRDLIIFFHEKTEKSLQQSKLSFSFEENCKERKWTLISSICSSLLSLFLSIICFLNFLR